MQQGLSVRHCLALICLLASIAGVGARCAVAQSESFPTRPIQLIVPFSAGASTDLLARFIAPGLNEALGKPVIVENRPGAGGLVGGAYVVNSRPDGQTLLVASSTVLQSPLLQLAPAFNATTDLAPISAVFQHPFVAVTGTSLPVKTIADFLTYARANPGKINTASLGGFSDIISAMFIKAAGIKAQIIPYRGAAEAMIGVIRGDAHLTFNAYGALRAELAGGRIRMLAVTSAERSAVIPDIPTLAESGLTGFDVINVVGLLAPAQTPKTVIDRLHTEVTRIMMSPEGKKFVAGLGADETKDYSPEHYRVLIGAADRKYRHVIDELQYQKQ